MAQQTASLDVLRRVEGDARVWSLHPSANEMSAVVLMNIMRSTSFRRMLLSSAFHLLVRESVQKAYFVVRVVVLVDHVRRRLHLLSSLGARRLRLDRNSRTMVVQDLGMVEVWVTSHLLLHLLELLDARVHHIYWRLARFCIVMHV